MDSVVKLGHQIKGDPVIQVCHLLQLFHLSFSVRKSHPLIVFAFLVQAFFKINHLPRDSFLLQTSFVLLKGFALMISETVTHFSQEGGFMDMKFQDVGGITSFLNCCNYF